MTSLSNLECGATSLDLVQLDHLVEGLIQPFGVLVGVAGECSYLGYVEVL